MSKKFITLFLSFFIFLDFSFAKKEDNFSLEGTWTFEFTNNFKSCTLKGDKVVNNSDEDDTYYLILVFSKYKYSGGRIYGYPVIENYQSPSLKSGWQRTNTSVTGDLSHEQPPTGTYYPVVLVTTFEKQILDYLTFPNTFYYKNPTEDTVSSLKSQMDYAQRQMKIYDSLYYSTRGDKTSVIQASREWSNKYYSLKKELISLRYYPDDYKPIHYHIEEKSYSEYAKSTYTPSPSYSYTPSTTYSDPLYSSDYSDYSNSSNSSSGSQMHKVREVCKYCHGTGVDSSKEVTANYAGSSYKPYCATCKEYTYPHYHKNCIICQGSGYTEKWSY